MSAPTLFLKLTHRNKAPTEETCERLTVMCGADTFELMYTADGLEVMAPHLGERIVVLPRSANGVVLQGRARR